MFDQTAKLLSSTTHVMHEEFETLEPILDEDLMGDDLDEEETEDEEKDDEDEEKDTEGDDEDE